MATFFIGVCVPTITTLRNSIWRSDSTANPVTGAVRCPSPPMHHDRRGQRHIRWHSKDTFRNLSAQDSKPRSDDEAGAR